MTTHENFKDFINLVDNFSRATWTHLLSCKSNTPHIIKAFVSMIKNQFETIVKCIRTGNGLEFTNHESAIFFPVKGEFFTKNLVPTHHNKMV